MFEDLIHMCDLYFDYSNSWFNSVDFCSFQSKSKVSVKPSAVMDTCISLGEISAVTLALTRPSLGIFSGLTMTSMTGGWYHRVSPTEALLIGIVILQVFVLRYLELLPLDLNQTFHDGVFAGRRKRSSASNIRESDPLTRSLLTILRRLDHYDCVPRFLCEAQPLVKERKLSKKIHAILEALQRFGLQERKCFDEQVWTNGTFVDNQRPVIAELVEAMLHQQSCIQSTLHSVSDKRSELRPHKPKNCTCTVRYAPCPLSTEEIFQLVKLVD